MHRAVIRRRRKRIEWKPRSWPLRRVWLHNLPCSVGYFRQKDGRRNRRFVPAEFRLFHGSGNSRNSVPKHSAEDKNAQNSVTWNKNRSKLSEFRSEPFRGRENNSEFRSAEQNRSKLSKFRSLAFRRRKHTLSSVCWIRTNFFMWFRSVPSFGIDSSVKLGMPRNEPFLPQNNRNRLSLFPGIFSEWNSVHSDSARWKQLLNSNDRNRVRWVILSLSQDGVCTDLFENRNVKSSKWDLSNDITFNPPIFSLANTFKRSYCFERNSNFWRNVSRRFIA